MKNKKYKGGSASRDWSENEPSTNWLIRLSSSENEVLKSIIGRGWTKEQMSRDGVQIWQKGNDFRVSWGDWAVMDIDDIYKSIRYVHPDAEIDGDAEIGCPEGNWETVF